MKPWLNIISITSMLLGAPFIYGDELNEAFYPVRPLGMGGAFTSIGNDENTVWTNPAGISRTKKPKSKHKFNLLAFPALVIGGNSQAQTFNHHYSDGDGSHNEKIVSAMKTLVEEGDGTLNKPVWAFVGVNPMAFVSAGFYDSSVLGLYSSNRLKIIPDTVDNTSAQVQTVYDTGVILGSALSTRLNTMSFGIQVRGVRRSFYDDFVSYTTLANSSEMQTRMELDNNIGTGIAADAGLLFTIPDFWYPSLGLAIINLPTGCVENVLNPYEEKRQTICGAVYSGSIVNQESLLQVDPTDIRMGVSLTPRISTKVAMRIAVDLHHLYVNSGETYYGLSGVEASKLLHAGVELFVGNPLLIPPFSLRFGQSQGFTSYGLSLRIKFFSLELASYGQDVSSAKSSTQDRRNLLNFSMEF